MKSTSSILLLALGALFVMSPSCELAEKPDSGRTEHLEVRIVSSPSTKIAVDGTSGIFSWQEKDSIAILIVNSDNTAVRKYVPVPLTPTVSAPNYSVITLSLSSGQSRAGFAVAPASMGEGDRLHRYAYPIYHSVHQTTLNLNLPQVYWYEDISRWSGDSSPIPMVARASSEFSTLDFVHVAGLFRVSLQNVPQGTRTIELEFDSDKAVWGNNIPVLFDPSDPFKDPFEPSLGSIENGGLNLNKLVFHISGSAEGISEPENIVINVPMPPATYTTLTVMAKDGTGAELESAAFSGLNLAFTRTRGKKAYIKFSGGGASIHIEDLTLFGDGLGQDFESPTVQPAWD